MPSWRGFPPRVRHRAGAWQIPHTNRKRGPRRIYTARLQLDQSGVSPRGRIIHCGDIARGRIAGGGEGAAYLGAQGDEWDAQKDMALATLGSVITMVATALYLS